MDIPVVFHQTLWGSVFQPPNTWLHPKAFFIGVSKYLQTQGMTGSFLED